MQYENISCYWLGDVTVQCVFPDGTVELVPKTLFERSRVITVLALDGAESSAEIYAPVGYFRLWLQSLDVEEVSMGNGATLVKMLIVADFFADTACVAHLGEMLARFLIQVEDLNAPPKERERIREFLAPLAELKELSLQVLSLCPAHLGRRLRTFPLHMQGMVLESSVPNFATERSLSFDCLHHSKTTSTIVLSCLQSVSYLQKLAVHIPSSALQSLEWSVYRALSNADFMKIPVSMNVYLTSVDHEWPEIFWYSQSIQSLRVVDSRSLCVKSSSTFLDLLSASKRVQNTMRDRPLYMSFSTGMKKHISTYCDVVCLPLIRGVSNLPYLKHLTLDGCSWAPELHETLVELVHLESLDVCTVVHDLGTQKKLSRAINSLSQLTSLKLSHSRLEYVRIARFDCMLDSIHSARTDAYENHLQLYRIYIELNSLLACELDALNNAVSADLGAIDMHKLVNLNLYDCCLNDDDVGSLHLSLLCGAEHPLALAELQIYVLCVEEQTLALLEDLRHVTTLTHLALEAWVPSQTITQFEHHIGNLRSLQRIALLDCCSQAPMTSSASRAPLLTSLTGLTSLTIKGFIPAEVHTVDFFSSLCNFSQLRYLRLVEVSVEGSSDALSQAFLNLPQLEDLTLQSCELSSSDITLPVAMMNLSLLTALTLSNLYLETSPDFEEMGVDIGIESVVQTSHALSRQTRLTSLQISYMDLDYTTVLMAALVRTLPLMSSLKQLSVKGCVLTENSYEVFRQGSSWRERQAQQPNINKLEWCYNTPCERMWRLSDIISTFPNLENISLAGLRLAAPCRRFRHLVAPLTGLAHLTELNLQDSGSWEGPGLKAIAKLVRNMPQLRKVLLSPSEVSGSEVVVTDEDQEVQYALGDIVDELSGYSMMAEFRRWLLGQESTDQDPCRCYELRQIAEVLTGRRLRTARVVLGVAAVGCALSVLWGIGSRQVQRREEGRTKAEKTIADRSMLLFNIADMSVSALAA